MPEERDPALDALGIERIDQFVEVPAEWRAIGYRIVEGKKGKYSVLQFARPNDVDIELWSHSYELRGKKVWVRKDHLTRQADEARKR